MESETGDPPKSPLKRGTLNFFPPLLQGGLGGDLRINPCQQGLKQKLACSNQLRAITIHLIYEAAIADNWLARASNVT